MAIVAVKVAFTATTPSIDEVKAKFDEASVEWHTIGTASWDTFPWVPFAEFRIMHSETEIYLQFHVRKEGARAVYGFDAGSKPYTDDCTEFFMIPSDTDPSYFNLELNCIGHGTFNWGPDRKDRHHGSDDLISQIRRESTLGSEPFGQRNGEQEWTLTIAIPKKLYKMADPDLADFSGRTVKANFYKCGDDTPRPHYISWNRIGTPKPQFHAPEYFGDVKFE